MNLIDLLLKLQIPAWLVLLLAIAGTLAMTYYKHKLERRVRELEHRFSVEAINHEKDLEFVQERHRKRLDVLDEVNAVLGEFDHALDHLRIGDSSYADRLQKYYKKARTLSREREALLGDEFYQAVVKKSDLGKDILRASFTLTHDSFKNLGHLDLPNSVLDALRRVIGKQVPVTDAEQLVQGLDERVLWRYKRDIFDSCTLSEEFDGPGNHKAELHLQNLKEQLLRTLPRPPYSF